MKNQKNQKSKFDELKTKLWKPMIVVLVALFVVAGVGFAADNGLEIPVKFLISYEAVLTAPVDMLGAYIASPTTWTDVNITNDLVVDKNTTLNATTTLQEVTIGSRFSKALTFTAGATTTPGNLVSIQNTGATKICDLAQLYIYTASSVGGQSGTGTGYQFGLGTSTAATNWTGATLIASTTVATSTTGILDSQENVGTYAMKSFIWTAGEYINGAFNPPSSQTDASSTAYTSMAGKLYLQCHTK